MKLKTKIKPGICHAARCTSMVAAPETLCSKHAGQTPDAPETGAQLVLDAGPEADTLTSTKTELVALLATAATLDLSAKFDSPAGPVDGLGLIGQLREYARLTAKEQDEQRKAKVAPFLAGQREWNERYRPIADACAAVIKQCDDRIREHARLVSEEQRKALANVAAVAEQGGTPDAIRVAHETAVALSTELPPQVRLSTDFEFDIEDPELVPREFLDLNPGRLLRAIRETQGTRAIPGVRIRRVEAVKTR